MLATTAIEYSKKDNKKAIEEARPDTVANLFSQGRTPQEEDKQVDKERTSVSAVVSWCCLSSASPLCSASSHVVMYADRLSH